MNARSIALQGIGYSALVVALQGFGPTEVTHVAVGPPPSQLRHVLPIDVKRAQKLDEDELLLVIITAALEIGLLEPT